MTRPISYNLSNLSIQNIANNYYLLNKNKIISQPIIYDSDSYYLQCCCEDCFCDIITDIVYTSGSIDFTISSIKYTKREYEPVIIATINCSPEPSPSFSIEPQPTDEPDGLFFGDKLLSSINNDTDNLIFNTIEYYGDMDISFGGFIQLPVMNCDETENISEYVKYLPDIDTELKLIAFNNIELNNYGLIFHAVVINALKIEDRIVSITINSCNN